MVTRYQENVRIIGGRGSAAPYPTPTPNPHIIPITGGGLLGTGGLVPERDPPSRSLEEASRKANAPRGSLEEVFGLEETSRKPRGARGTPGALEEASRRPRGTDKPRGSSRNIEELYDPSRKPRGTIEIVEEASRSLEEGSRKARGASRNAPGRLEEPRGSHRRVQEATVSLSVVCFFMVV